MNAAMAIEAPKSVVPAAPELVRATPVQRAERESIVGPDMDLER